MRGYIIVDWTCRRNASGRQRWERLLSKDQTPAGKAFVIREAWLTTAIHEAGFIMTDIDPDYVVLRETRSYSFEAITKAIRLINAGARFIATNPDATRPSAKRRASCNGRRRRIDHACDEPRTLYSG